MPPLTQSDLVFSSPQANHNFSQILTDLKRANLSIGNRLRSIRQDAAFVAALAAAYGLPLVANERCGSWYVPPGRKAASAYFKSTDGHAGQWSFSTRRLNLHLLLDVIAAAAAAENWGGGREGGCGGGGGGGCVVVDSTRRGKGMPDALSKTVPVWCCVVNRVVFPDRTAWHALHLPPAAVGESERSQIEARIPAFVDSFLALEVDLAPLRGRLKKPLRPVWRTQDDGLPEGEELALRDGEFYPVVCCTSSRRVVGAEMSEAGYIQGAADDTENWAHGLTAQIWWRHADELLATAEGDLPGLIERLVALEGEEAGRNNPRRLTDVLYVSALPVDELGLRTCLVKLVPEVTDEEMWLKSKTEMEVGIGKSKTGGRNLRHALQRICWFVKGFLDSNTGALDDEQPRARVIVACETGKDLSVGCALALDCWCFDDSARLKATGEQAVNFTKAAIRVRLGRIMTAMPEANPSRTTLQSVNSFLMDWQR